MNKLDLQTEKYIINKFISMPKLFDSLDIDYRIDGNMFCPFHQNVKTPSAHLYHDDNGYRLWCFSEYYMYGAWDVYKIYMPKINTNKLATMIFENLPLELQKKLLLDIDVEQDLLILPFKQELIDFKHHKLNYKNLLQKIAFYYQDDII